MSTRNTIKIGDLFQTPMADSIVTFKVVKIVGERVTATAEPDPFEVDGVTYPGDYDGVTQDFLIDNVKQAIAHARNLAVLSSRTHVEADRFWASREVGDVIHYNNYGNAWVRGEVVLLDGEKIMLPTALVGSWDRVDLPQRRADGAVYYPYHANKVVTGETWTPAAWAFWESKSAAMDRRTDPTGLPVLDLALPAPTPEEAIDYANERILNSIVKIALESGSPSARLAQVRALLPAEVSA